MVHTEPRRLLRDALAIAKGTALGHAPFVLASPLLTRLYTPGELGGYGLAMAFISVAAPVSALRFELAAISARQPSEARELLVLGVLTAIAISAGCALLLGALKVAHLASYDLLSWPVVAVAGATVTLSAAWSLARSWLVRRHDFARVARSLAVQGILRAIVPVALAALHGGALVLLGAELLSRAVAVAMIASRIGVGHAAARVRESLHGVRATARRYWKYPVLLGPSTLLDAASLAVSVPIVAACYGLNGAGEFALVQRLVMLPAAFIGGSFGDVFHSHARQVAQGASGSFKGFLKSTARRLLLFATLVYVPGALIGAFTAQWVFGREWTAAGNIIAALAPACIAQTVVSPLSRSLLLGGREERKLIADLISLVLPSGALYLASGRPLAMAVLWYSIASVIAFAVYFVVIMTSVPGPGRTDARR